VVNAAGPWSAGLAKTAKIDLPVSIYREQETIWECPHADEMPPSSISNSVDAIYLRPMGQRRYTVGRGFPKEYTEADPKNYVRGVDDWFVNDILTRVQRRFPPFARARCIDGFASLYDVTPDWYPFVGLRRDVPGYADASGGSGHGFKLAPALGKHLARWISSGRVTPEVARLSYDRVPDGRMFVQKYGGNRG
jgi:sarcosine oxidase subunit beta